LIRAANKNFQSTFKAGAGLYKSQRLLCFVPSIFVAEKKLVYEHQ
jgi:hypothetical protein